MNAVKAQVDEQSKKVSGKVKSDTLIQDELVTGAVAVTGEGITMTLADPIAASQSDNPPPPDGYHQQDSRRHGS